jgi:hypothetical protein
MLLVPSYFPKEIHQQRPINTEYRNLPEPTGLAGMVHLTYINSHPAHIITSLCQHGFYNDNGDASTTTRRRWVSQPSRAGSWSKEFISKRINIRAAHIIASPHLNGPSNGDPSTKSTQNGTLKPSEVRWGG